MSDYEDFDPTQYIPGEYDPPSDSPRVGTYSEFDGFEDDEEFEPPAPDPETEKILANRERYYNWGGKRDGAGSGGKRDGAGRKPTTLKVKLPAYQLEFLKYETERTSFTADYIVSELLREFMNKRIDQGMYPPEE